MAFVQPYWLNKVYNNQMLNYLVIMGYYLLMNEEKFTGFFYVIFINSLGLCDKKVKFWTPKIKSGSHAESLVLFKLSFTHGTRVGVARGGVVKL